MSPALFFSVGHLPRKNGLEFRLGHARSRQNALTLDRFWRAHHDHEINVRFPAGFEQQRHVDDDEPPSSRRRALYELNARLGDCRVHKSLEALQRLCIAEHPRAEALAIDLARNHYARERRLDRFCAISGVEVAHGVIGVEYRHSQFAEHASDGRLPHRDGARQPGHDHRAAS